MMMMDIEDSENQPPTILNENDSLLIAVKRKPLDPSDHPLEQQGDEPSPKRRALNSVNQQQLQEEQPLSLTLARVQEAPDHTHLSLASEAVKRRLSSRSKQHDQPPKHQNESVVQIAGEKCDTLSNAPGIVIPIKATGADRFAQISLFFASPVPKLLCGPDDEGESMFGVAMEYHLLQLVQADVASAAFLNVVGWEEEGHALIDQKIQDYQR
jgi:hypothetical protein